MAKQRKQRSTQNNPGVVSQYPPLLRVVGRERPVQQILRTAARAGDKFAMVQINGGSTGNRDEPAAEDYAQIDPALAVQPAPLLSEPPQPGAGYSGFTPVQRHHFLQWATHAEVTAPPAFRRLYLAQLEVSLFDTAAKATAARAELLHLADAPAWQREEALWRALLLTYWLQQDGPALSRWLADAPALPPALTGLAFGLLAWLGEELTVEHLSWLARQWQLADLPELPVLRLRFAFLRSTIEQEPLAHALAAVEATATAAKPWRCAHRQLRVALPQPDLRPTLEPLLTELATMVEAGPSLTSENRGGHGTSMDGDDFDGNDEEAAALAATLGPSAEPTKSTWRLVLEFGESHSGFFDIVLTEARRRPGYVQIMDENRRMVHRIRFEKKELRYFWILWEYVQSWSSTQVFVNGKELRTWEVYPYSPYLR
ncbi:MAG: hypothetical protein KDE19_11930 [Caldilineaceae bacterium]|nr:hypothetical protein [Caldilineaceae bacterium]